MTTTNDNWTEMTVRQLDASLQLNASKMDRIDQCQNLYMDMSETVTRGMLLWRRQQIVAELARRGLLPPVWLRHQDD